MILRLDSSHAVCVCASVAVLGALGVSPRRTKLLTFETGIECLSIQSVAHSARNVGQMQTTFVDSLKLKVTMAFVQTHGHRI